MQMSLKSSQTLTEDVIGAMAPEDLQRLKDLLFFKIYAVYMIKKQKMHVGSTEDDYTFLGAYSSEQKARDRVLAYQKLIPKVGVHKDQPLHRLTVYEYILDRSKGTQLYRDWSRHGDLKFGPIPISNDKNTAFRPMTWAFPGSTCCISEGNEVTIDQDVYEK
jgi:hypothetical protein